MLHAEPARPLDETYGGQAVIEGVMMRDRTAMCIAVRTPFGAIASRRHQLGAVRRWPLFRLPVLRGMLALYDSVKLGIDALLWSAGAAGGWLGKIKPKFATPVWTRSLKTR